MVKLTALAQAGLNHTLAGEITRHQHYLATVEKSPLTVEQSEATVAMPSRMLLVAAAGSGKTSVMVAKVGYGLLTEQLQVDQILVLAFNNKAAQELLDRLHHRLGQLIPDGQGVKTKTFHALGLEIISAVQGSRPQIADSTAKEAIADSLALNTLITRCVKQDPLFAEQWLLFRLFYCRNVRNPASFNTHKQWLSFVRENGSGSGRRLGFLSLQGDMLRSQCELAVANWLYLQGVPYKYARVPSGTGLGFWHRRKLLGFLLLGKPYWIVVLPDSEQDYRRLPIASKALCLSFDDMVSGRLFTRLRAALAAWGQPLQPCAGERMLQQLGGDMSSDELVFLSHFIHHARSNTCLADDLQARATRHVQADRAGVLAGFLGAVLKARANQLMLNNQLDFQEMINRASHYVDTARYIHPYRLILVDEFQDTSQASAALIQAMLKQSAACKLFVVGDDWQSIYRFAGADTRLFTDFSDYFGPTDTRYLSASFRFNQGIADVASAFIQTNPGQIKKQVKAKAGNGTDSIVIVRYDKSAGIPLACAYCLDDIQQEIGGTTPATVYILGRYRHQRPVQLVQWQTRYAGLDLTFKTMHASKGLEADYVLILGLHSGRYAFPSDMGGDPLLQLVMPEQEIWPDAEERRLLYVAMTRARHKVYLVASAPAPSRFVTELAGYPGVVDAGLVS